jgi:CRISPR/Cas system CSM-associated protein Csm3 (group 7 of RAMP superfamily)
MADINYKVTFYSDWHCGSGLTSGSESDNLVIKDKHNLPVIPGKTIKGLLKEAASDLFEGDTDFNDFIKTCFGIEDSESTTLFHYSSARLSIEEINYLKDNDTLKSKLYRNIPSTRISDETGVAVENTLRTMQVTIPLALQGTIRDIPLKHKDKMFACLKMVKRLGYKRNRGFGRCSFEIDQNKKGGQQ